MKDYLAPLFVMVGKNKNPSVLIKWVLTIHMHRYNKLQHSDCGVKSFTYGVRKRNRLEKEVPLSVAFSKPVLCQKSYWHLSSYILCPTALESRNLC